MNRISDSTLKEADFLCDYIRSNFPKLNELQLQVILLNYDLSGQIETNFINFFEKYGFNSLPNFKDEEIILLVVDYLFTFYFSRNSKITNIHLSTFRLRERSVRRRI